MQDTPASEIEQPHVRRADAGKSQVNDLVGREDLVLEQHADQPAIACGEVAGEPGVVFGGVDDRGAVALRPVCSERALRCWVGDQ